MKQKKIIFRDREIVDFCNATKDTNEIHNRDFMKKMGKRVIVPGMFALARTLNLETQHLKSNVNCIRVLFNSLLSSGDFATLCTIPNPDDPSEVRLSAFNHKDTLTSKDDYTRMFRHQNGVESNYKGILRRLPIEEGQIKIFSELIGTTDTDITNFLFAIAYASRALINCIDEPKTEVESEIDRVINGNSKISPFYQSLEIYFPEPFPVFTPQNSFDYYIHIERVKPNKLYMAHVYCECEGTKVYHSKYKLMGIHDQIILRMAKDANPVKSGVSG